MKALTILLVSFASWVVAHPGLPPLGKVENNSESDKFVSIQKEVKPEKQEKPNGLIGNLMSLKDKFTPQQMIENGKLEEQESSNVTQQNIEKYGNLAPIPLGSGKDNFIISAILNAIQTTGDVIETAKEVIQKFESDILKVIKLHVIDHVENIPRASLGFEKIDSSRLKGHESSDKDDSQLSTGIEGIDMNEVKESYSNGYRKSTEGDSKEIASEKHVIHSADSLVSSKENAKTDTRQRKHSEGSQISTKLEEKSASIKKQSHSAEKAEKKSLTSAKEETS